MVFACALQSSRADDVFDNISLTWTGSGSAQATSSFTLDITALQTALDSGGGIYDGALTGYISDLTLTVTGASTGNGTFTTSDFSSFVFNTSGTVDLTGDWATDPNIQDFNLFSSNPSAPTGSSEKTLSTDGFGGDILTLSSTSASPVPEPGTFALAGLGGLAGFFSLKRRFFAGK
jgi:hypothetical protein